MPRIDVAGGYSRYRYPARLTSIVITGPPLTSVDLPDFEKNVYDGFPTFSIPFAPAVLLSGLMFPIENMPAAVQFVTYLNPLRYLLVIIRGIFLKGSGMFILWPQFLALFILGASVVAASSLRFTKRLSKA